MTAKTSSSKRPAESPPEEVGRSGELADRGFARGVGGWFWDRRFSWLAFLGPLILYSWTLAPTVTLEDSGEFITAAAVLGVPHPPGYPVWCLGAHLFTWIPWGTIPERVHLFSAVAGAGTCWMVYLIGRRLTADPWSSLAAAWTLAVSRYLWSQSVIAEVYSLNAFFVATCIYSIIRWHETGQWRWPHLLALTVGLGTANHFLLVLFTPIFAVWMLLREPERLLDRRLAYSVTFLLLGLSFYVYLPIRASANPVLNVGNPDNWERLTAHILRTTYASGSETIRQSGTLTDGFMHAGEAVRRHAEAFKTPMLVFAGLGLVVLTARDRRIGAALWSMILFNDLLTNILLKEPFNASWSYVHRVYYIPADVVLAVGIAVGLSMFTHDRRYLGLGLVGLILYVLGVGLKNEQFGNRRDERLAETVGKDFLRSLPSEAGVLPLDDFLYTLHYLIHVEKFRPDVQILRADFGYDGKRPPAGGVYSMVPVTEPVAESLGWKQTTESIPEGLAYRVMLGTARPGERRQESLANFKEIDPAPAVPQPFVDPDDIFGQFAHGLVANYYTRVGQKRHLEGLEKESREAFDRAEQSAANAWSKFELATAYRSLNVRPERVMPLLQDALRLHERYFDPSSERFIPVHREDIVRAIEELDSSPGK